MTSKEKPQHPRHARDGAVEQFTPHPLIAVPRETLPGDLRNRLPTGCSLAISYPQLTARWAGAEGAADYPRDALSRMYAEHTALTGKAAR